MLIPLVVGTGLAAASLEESSYVAFSSLVPFIGMGQGPSYTLGLATVTHRLLRRFQGKPTSTYALVAYDIRCSCYGYWSCLLGVGACQRAVSDDDGFRGGRRYHRLSELDSIEQWKSVTI